MVQSQQSRTNKSKWTKSCDKENIGGRDEKKMIHNENE